MQIYALDGTRAISAVKALKQKNYLCPECGQAVRVRQGFRRQVHFFHVWIRPGSRPPCRQGGKSLTHLQIQLHLKSSVGELRLERPFPAIGRIADAAWEERKIIFEVQCSPISPEEARKRTEDYASLGYRVVWILHDKQFNKKALSPAEEYLRPRPCYYARGTHIYDQFEILAGNRRLFKGPPLAVDLKSPLEASPAAVLKVLRQRHFAFRGDLLDSAMRKTDLSSLRRLERRLLRPKRWFWGKMYRLLLYKLLERFST